MHRLLLVCLLPLVLMVAPCLAIDVILPSDFMHVEVADLDAGNEGYYMVSGTSVTPPPVETKPYAFIIDARGNIVWYKTNTRFDNLGNFSPMDSGHFIHARGNSNHPHSAVVLAPDYAILDTVEKVNPYRDTMDLDAHEYLRTDDGHLYTLWWDPVPVDLSPWGGNPNAIVQHHTIQEWDETGALLWEWRSIDHIDDLPYDGRVDTGQLNNSSMEHLHINSFQVLPDGDLVISARMMDIVFRVDRATGGVEWKIGWGPENEFSFTTDLPDPPPVRFNSQHDARYFPGDNRLTVFDNGNRHQNPRSYGREYVLDVDAMTADLVWAYAHPDEFYSQILGSTRIVEDGKRLICWGGGSGDGRPTTNATEVTADNDVVWELNVSNSPNPDGFSSVYRVHKLASLEPAGAPYVSEVSYAETRSIELYCNWFGHEDEVAGYQVWWGYSEENMRLRGVSDDGLFVIEDADPLVPYYCQIRAVDGNGDPFGPGSNVIKVQIALPGIMLGPLVSSLPAEGGSLYYSANFTSTSSEEQTDLTYVTWIVLPNGNPNGPLVEDPITLAPYSRLTISGLIQEVPGTSPGGTYEFHAAIENADGVRVSEDMFTFVKTGQVGAEEDYLNPELWSAGGDWPFGEPGVVPQEFQIVTVAPNPFNGLATVALSLPRAGELRVDLLNTLGRRVTTLADGAFPAGQHRLTLNGSHLATGLYLLRATTPGEAVQVRKVVLVK